MTIIDVESILNMGKELYQLYQCARSQFSRSDDGSKRLINIAQCD
ncbi:unnamed protein product [Larinioides sclopetarius]|uniref:Uncharacterized protein n=1 Tax=Larinioides sclopetarius TaxID=280406 RepID=A0AAV2AM76_9ARAC